MIVFQTFSKAWGCAAIRLGMAFASKEIISIFSKIKYPYNVNLLTQKEAVMMEKGTADMQHNLEILGNDLKGSNCLTPRRTIQNVSNTFNIRLLKIEERATQYFRLKEINLLRKVSEVVTTHQTINFSTLLCRMGYHVYALRKIII